MFSANNVIIYIINNIPKCKIAHELIDYINAFYLNHFYKSNNIRPNKCPSYNSAFNVKRS